MQVSTRLDPQDQNYFNDNFKIMDKSPEVHSLDDADVILLGDNHTKENHEIKNLWLIHKLARKGDMVFQESLPISRVSKSPGGIYWSGWDSFEARKKIDFLEAIICEELSILESIDPSSSGSREIQDAIRAANAKIPLNSIEALEKEIERLEKPKYYIPISSWKTDCDTIAKKAEAIQTEKELKDYFGNFIREITFFWLRFLGDSTDLLGIVRNRSLAQKIASNIGKNQITFVTAGKLHLHFHQNKEQGLGIKEGISLLKNSLSENNKKYVVLFPRNKGSIDYANRFLNKQKLITNIFNFFANNIFGLISMACVYLSEKTIHRTSFMKAAECLLAFQFIRVIYEVIEWATLPTSSYKSFRALKDRKNKLIEKWKLVN